MNRRVRGIPCSSQSPVTENWERQAAGLRESEGLTSATFLFHCPGSLQSRQKLGLGFVKRPSLAGIENEAFQPFFSQVTHPRSKQADLPNEQNLWWTQSPLGPGPFTRRERSQVSPPTRTEAKATRGVELCRKTRIFFANKLRSI